MLKNYLTIAVRNLQKHPTLHAINIAGLAVGMACCVLMLLFVRHELSYDRFHDDADRIYRVQRASSSPTGIRFSATTPAGLAPSLQTEYAGVEKAVRFMLPFPQEKLIEYEDQKVYETGLLWTDATVFDVFDFPLLAGDPETALVEPFTLVLTEEAATKYFGDLDPIGQTLRISGWQPADYTVTGVLAPIPDNSHLPFQMLASMAGEEPRYDFLFTGEGRWSNSLFYTYVRLADAAYASILEPELAPFAERHMGAFATSRGFTPNFSLMPLLDLHLRNEAAGQREPTGDIRYVYLFGLIAAFILLLACVNAMNLATAQATDRAKEIGLRKTLGAFRKQLITQLLGEAILGTLLAVIFTIALIEFLLPLFNHLTNKALTVHYLRDTWLLFGLIGLSIGVGLLSGVYPAFVLANLQPLQVLKGPFRASKRGSNLQRGLVIFQFTISITLIAATVIMYQQLRFMNTQSLGFNHEQVVALPIRSQQARNNIERLKTTLQQHPSVVQAAASAGLPGRLRLIDSYAISTPGAPANEQQDMLVMGVDYDFMDLLELNLLEGRGFSEAFSTDADHAFIVNEAAAQLMGWDEAVGQPLFLNEGDGKTGVVIGVVEDFHLRSLHHSIEPLVIHVWPERHSFLSIRTEAANFLETIAFAETTWASFVPDQPFDYVFLDEAFGAQYATDIRISEVFTYFSILAIFIACLGLFGLALFTTQQRTKEVGIRKVLGASAQSVMFLITRAFLQLVGIAFLLAIPLAYLGTHRWLQDFSYAITPSPALFLISGLLAFLVAGITVGTLALRTAFANPIDALRTE